MKRIWLLLVLPLVLLSSPAWANCCMMEGMGRGMMGDMGSGSGMMGPGMMGGMGGMGMGPGMMGGMGGRGLQSCMMQECWQEDLHGGMGGSMPHTMMRSAIREISGYQVNAAALGLSEDQLQRLSDIKEALTAAMIRTHADLQIGGMDIRRQMTREPLDLAAVEKILNSQNQMLSKLQKTAIKAVADARNVLTAQQRQQAKKLSAAGPMMRRPMQQQPPGTAPEHEQHHGGGN